MNAFGLWGLKLDCRVLQCTVENGFATRRAQPQVHEPRPGNSESVYDLRGQYKYSISTHSSSL